MLKLLKRKKLSRRLHQIFLQDKIEGSFGFLSLYLKYGEFFWQICRVKGENNGNIQQNENQLKCESLS